MLSFNEFVIVTKLLFLIRVIANSSHSCFLIHRSVFKARHGGDPPYILDISFISRDVSGAEEQETERLWESLSILQQWWNFSLQCSWYFFSIFVLFHFLGYMTSCFFVSLPSRTVIELQAGTYTSGSLNACITDDVLCNKQVSGSNLYP